MNFQLILRFRKYEEKVKQERMNDEMNIDQQENAIDDDSLLL